MGNVQSLYFITFFLGIPNYSTFRCSTFASWVIVSGDLYTFLGVWRDADDAVGRIYGPPSHRFPGLPPIERHRWRFNPPSSANPDFYGEDIWSQHPSCINLNPEENQPGEMEFPIDVSPTSSATSDSEGLISNNFCSFTWARKVMIPLPALLENTPSKQVGFYPSIPA